ncbi:MAG: group II intron reverse transcriptase/maturase [Actinomycetota bacterium]|nr:group II intron reverse transcriptase/maturase [Actinomycetota bacterium]
MNTGAPLLTPLEAEARVLGIQAKLHRWATDDPDRRFDDLDNLISDPAFLLVAWRRVRGNKGARTAGVDGQTARTIEAGQGVAGMLQDLRVDLKARRFQPLPVRERRIPKPGTHKRRRLGIPAVRDRVVQGALKLVLEPIFEADFKPCSYGFRPKHRARDAIAEIHYLATPARNYEWVLEADIAACFDEISHSALLERMRGRVSDKRVLGLVKAFLKAGILSEDGVQRDTDTGTPQGGIASPLLANIALSVLDDHFAERWGYRVERAKRRRHGLANYRIIRYADDFVIMVSGTEAHAHAIRDEVASVLSTMGLRLSKEKTGVVHIDEGLDFLGWRIQRQTRRGTTERYVYTYPSKKALRAVMAKVRTLTHGGSDLSLEVLLHRLNPVLRGWTNYFRSGVSSATFQYLGAFTWRRVIGWLRRKHPRITWKQLRRRYLSGEWWPTENEVTLFNTAAVRTSRYRYRGAAIPSSWPSVA